MTQQLIRVAWNLHVPEDRIDDLRTVCALAVETSAPESVVAWTTAARLHGLWLPPGTDALHLATAAPQRPGRSMTRTRRPQIVAHRLQLDPDEQTVVRGIPVTTIARTWRDLAGSFAVPDLVAAGDSALRAGVSREELAQVVNRSRSFRGAHRARAALPLLDERSRSRPESHLRVAVTVPDLPPFAVNEPVHRAGGGWLAEPDLSLAEARIAMEYQGGDHGTVLRMRKDLTRFADMRRDGWLCLAYGPAETFGRPWEITADARAAVRERAPHLLRPRRRPRVVT